MLKFSKTLAFCLLAVSPAAVATDWVPDQLMLRAGNDVQTYTPYWVYMGGERLIGADGTYAAGSLAWDLPSPGFAASVFIQRSESFQEFNYSADHDVRFTRVGAAISGEVFATETMSVALSAGLGQLRWNKLDIGILGDPHGCLPEFEVCAPPTPETISERTMSFSVIGRYSPTEWAEIFAGVGRQELSFTGTTYQMGITIRVHDNLFIELRRFDEIITEGNTAGLSVRF